MPVAWVYTWTHSSSDRATGLPEALLVLPVTIALVVYLVKGSLALAFSLAGIMAAVRFRTVLSDVLDSGFLMMAIGMDWPRACSYSEWPSSRRCSSH